MSYVAYCIGIVLYHVMVFASQICPLEASLDQNKWDRICMREYIETHHLKKAVVAAVAAAATISAPTALLLSLSVYCILICQAPILRIMSFIVS